MHKKTAVFAIGIVTTIIFLFLTWEPNFKYFDILTRVNLIFYDVNLKIFHKKNKSTDIVIVDIDEKSLQDEGRWPWSRNKIAAMTKNLQNSDAAVIVFDILFPEQEPDIADTLLKHARQGKDIAPQVIDYLSQQLPSFDNDKIFASALTKSDVVLGVFFSKDLYHSTGKLGKPIFSLAQPVELVVLHESKFIGNTPVLADAVRYTGFTTTIPDVDGYLRRAPLLIEHNKELYPSLALATVKAYLLTEKFSLDLRDLGKSKIFLGVTLGNTYIPTDLAGNVLITYGGPAFSFPYVSATDVLHNKFPPQTFAGKIVLIGSSAIGIGDLHATPLQSVGYPGTEVHASIIASILNKNIISSPLWLVGIERIVIVIISLIATILAAYLPALGLILLTAGIMLLLFIFNAVLLAKCDWILPHLVLPYLQLLFLGIINSGCGYLFETRSRKKLHAVYGQYVSAAHIDKMLELPDKHPLDGNTKMMTVLFADVRSFTSISEKLDAKGIKKFLTTLFTPFTEIIFDCKGTIDKYVGDMIMAFWNDPIDDPEHASHAVQAALRMQSKVRELVPVFAEQKLPSIGVRIGVNTGMMHVGDMGSEYRKAYTVLGDAVNLASRLEGVNKMYGTLILVSQETKDLCNNIVFRFVDCIFVKGKATPTNVYEPLCLLSDKTAALETELTQYNKALELYNASNWSEAREKFTKLAKQYPETQTYTIYLERVSQYEASPPPLGWDRGQHLTEK
ncbi:adenylate cyclase [Gammaproteobacteria bacterium]